MRKKLEGNGLWESSRMMLPEHKSAIVESNEALKRRGRPLLDEQEWEAVSRSVAESLQLRLPITLRMFHPLEELMIIGIVDRVDSMRGRFMIDGEWFLIKDIEGVTSSD